jgi:uncharacterized protein YqeY
MSTLIEQIKTAFTDAYKSKNLELKNVIGTIKGEIERESKDPKNISDEEVTKELKKMLKKHDENPSLTEMEISFIESILPKQMTEAEIDAKLQELIDGGANHIGRIMGGFKGLNADMKIVKEKADKQLNLI